MQLGRYEQGAGAQGMVIQAVVKTAAFTLTHIGSHWSKF